MPNVQRFRLPDAGEGLTEAEIVTWRVRPGDTVRINDTIVEIETAKSLVELPSPFEGTVGELLVSEGQTVEVGTPIFTVTAGGEPTEAPVLRVAGFDVPFPPAKLEELYLPDADRILEAVDRALAY